MTEASFATHVEAWERNDRKEWLDTALRYAAWATLTQEGRAFHKGGTLFRVPQKINFQKLVPLDHHRAQRRHHAVPSGA